MDRRYTAPYDFAWKIVVYGKAGWLVQRDLRRAGCALLISNRTWLALRERESADQIRKVKGGLSELDSHYTTVHSWVVLGGDLRRQWAGCLSTVLSSPYEIVPKTLQVQALEPPGRLDTANVEG